ncbi:ABC transporter ATP-binding protein [Myceligenerans pegani]|uniref:ABC transporter ATP-binding protein n=1 Tax=Myceligenerans pegani TaxID=2776917 RepID=A0ABR9N5V3_9MICO|nr:ATP-binding cassette domain-containing protein [Myceligenerans sp. TRM 65318]MBE1878556.1 ABC transporter ATP-binding protein [Myceligenerans sp. TRM 65318]MBE3020827.1 ABC transporter ATP-binding protein [Myceligenerans sp. TRM 65318]
MTDALVVSGLTKTYRGAGRGPRVVAVDGISFTLAAGGSLGVVGESGSGKTTLAQMIVGLAEPDSGTVVIDGRDRRDLRRGRRARLQRATEAQMVFQDPYGSLDRRLDVAGALADTLRRHGTPKDRIARDVAALMDRVGLASRLANSRPHELSGGQRQRVAIAKALAIDPTVLVLDEAVSALDVSVQAQILTLLDEIRAESGVALVFVSHDLAVVGQVTDQILVMYRGRAVETGDTDQVLRRPEHPYTEMLLSSAPGPRWQPERVAELRAALAAAT